MCPEYSAPWKVFPYAYVSSTIYVFLLNMEAVEGKNVPSCFGVFAPLPSLMWQISNQSISAAFYGYDLCWSYHHSFKPKRINLPFVLLDAKMGFSWCWCLGGGHSCTIYVLYKMRYVSFLLVHIHGYSAKPITTTTLSKLLLYSIYLTITFTRHTGNDRDTEHTIGLTGSPAVKPTTKMSGL